MTTKPRIGPMLRLVLAMGWGLAPLARPLLKRRLAKGKEDPKRWGEKLGEATLPRPDGPLVWMHGVGVGEVMALRGLIDKLTAAWPDLHFLVTSSARSSGEVFAKNLPANTCHQYLPLDLPTPVNAFLDHWKPDLAIWSDQEIWPRMAVTCARRGIPQAYVAARITRASAKAKTRFGGAYGDLFRLLDARHAQDAGTAAHITALMGDDTLVEVTGSLKVAAAALADDPAVRAALPDRPTWVAASAHPADVTVALAAQKALRKENAKPPLLIIAPRNLADTDAIATECDALGLTHVSRSSQHMPDLGTDVFIADSFGELGIWFRASFAALIGGSFDATQGHNPWEAVALDCAVLHGTKVANFAADYERLILAEGSTYIKSASDLAIALQRSDLADQADRASQVRKEATQGLSHITTTLLGLLTV
ncbi:glycosyltransferase N-terminal domain-containing protein [Octadecabacter sp. 1_MG-2023]|uniref:3-deoxy-D-manno-octulosonic acid transferase n=1 Tax=unclassified Octadecabacter TaxID=196158 RepID=UPI001C09C5E7|nr:MULTISPECIES: glycosyltransferase N-terminal domain-containing protein [unclassified Octadecabacter]MBU2994677.1 3-deoxy-D-manno-octulosonic acid transferase [Octadecabacter sp. B2R22]MDO6734029.1 glycosyltransferase N-terminal domain-containing protein [Octadecabacter sp. 1_MG-2023]